MITERYVANLTRLVNSFIMEKEGGYALSVRRDFDEAMRRCDNLAGKVKVATRWLKVYNRLPRRELPAA